MKFGVVNSCPCLSTVQLIGVKEMFGFGKKEIKKKTIDLGQVEVVIVLYSGQIIKKTIKGYHDEGWGYYSPAKQVLSSFLEKVRKENVLEIMEGHFINISKEVKSVTYGEIQPLTIEVTLD
jgi:hypothetical protein